MGDRRARVADVHEIAAAMPHVTRIEGPKGNAIYQVGGKSFVFFRTPQPDAQDPDTGERYADVIMIWVESESDKLSLVPPWEGRYFHFDAVHLPADVIRQLRRTRIIAEVAHFIVDFFDPFDLIDAMQMRNDRVDGVASAGNAKPQDGHGGLLA